MLFLLYIYIYDGFMIYDSSKVYIYIYIYILFSWFLIPWEYIYIVGIRYPDEPLRRNYSRLVPNSLSNYRYYFALLSIEHFLHCRLAALTVVLSFDQPVACLLIFFNWYDKVGLFFFFQYIFFPLDSHSLYIFIFKSLAGFFTIRVII